MKFEIQAAPDAAFHLVRPSNPWTTAKVDQGARIVDVDIYCRFSEGLDELSESLTQILGWCQVPAGALGIIG